MDAIKLREGWLEKTMSNRHSGGETWEFTEHKPDYMQETYDCAKGEHVPGTRKRIMYVEVEEQ
jgi:hypothetical protein